MGHCSKPLARQVSQDFVFYNDDFMKGFSSSEQQCLWCNITSLTWLKLAKIRASVTGKKKFTQHYIFFIWLKIIPNVTGKFIRCSQRFEDGIIFGFSGTCECCRRTYTEAHHPKNQGSELSLHWWVVVVGEGEELSPTTRLHICYFWLPAKFPTLYTLCLLYTSDAADER